MTSSAEPAAPRCPTGSVRRRAGALALAALTAVAAGCGAPARQATTSGAPTSSPPSASPPRIISVAAAGTATLWVQLSDGQVLFSPDGGASWSDRTPRAWENSGAYAYAGQRLPGTAGETVGGEQAWLEEATEGPSGDVAVEVAGTSDAGVRWQATRLQLPSKDLQPIVSPAGVSVVGSDGWAAGTPASGAAYLSTDIFRTTDGGATWIYETTVAHATGPVYFVTPTVGFDGTTPGQFALWETRDGGQTWSQASLPMPSGLDDILIPTDPLFTNSTDGFLYANFETSPAAEPMHPYFYKTVDGGLTWTPQALPTSGEGPAGWPAWSVVNPSVWFLVADDVVMETTDGGSTWTSVKPDIPLTRVSFAQFVSDQVGYALIDTSTCPRSNAPAPPPCPATNGLAKTTDGGRTWQILSVPR
jgi:photosystem II stability/assembly factor-like uncharacterized protein